MAAALALAVQQGALPNVAATASGGAQMGMPHPTPGVESSDDPLGAPIAAPAGSGAYQFVQHQDDGVTPVAYDPCRPIHYVVRQANAPYGGDVLVQDAVARTSEITGLQFVYDGVTGEGPSAQREPYQPEQYGDRWAPVLVTWDTVTEQPDFITDTAGLAGSAAVSVSGGPLVFVTGTVELDAAQFSGILAEPDGQAIARAIVLHEFGHLVGLAHVDDPTQLMYPTTSQALDFAPGDLAGLSQLGAGACEPEV